VASLIEKPEKLAVETNGSAREGISDRVRSLTFEKPAVGSDGRRRGRRWLLYFVLVLFAVGAVLWRQGFSRKLFAPQAVELKVVTVQSDLSSAIVLDTSGYLMAQMKVQMLPKIPGTILELHIDEGTKVKKGDLLVQLDAKELVADLAASKASLAQAKARLDELVAGALPDEINQAESLLTQAEARAKFALQDFERAQQLYGTISKQEFDRAKSNYDEAKANVDHQTHALTLLKKGPRVEQIAGAKADVARSQANVDRAQVWLDSTRIVSPINGTVLEKHAELGERVNPEIIAAGLCTVADLSEMEVEVDVQERELTNVSVGQPCRIEPEAYPGQFYQGRVARIMPVANRQRGVVQIRVKVINNDGKLLPDMNCRVVILKAESTFTPDDKLRVPATAILGEPDAPVLFVLDGPIARRRPVKLGATANGMVVVKEGLFPGERVAIPGDLSLGDGQLVKPLSKDGKG
jgi:multidrug efflux pump subunit AcrA (membrane-fusion protein)